MLRQLPKRRYPTLPAYYEVEGLEVGSGNGYLLTNQPQSCLYTDFLTRNSQVLTLNTMLRLLNEIARTLLHLRNHEIISNNLVPYEVRVIEGLGLHLNCLGNAYHSTLEGRSLRSKSAARSQESMHRNLNIRLPALPEQPLEAPPCRNILPYVSHTHLGNFYSHSSEMSDVYSFGLLMFRTLFGRHLFDIRRSRLDELREF